MGENSCGMWPEGHRCSGKPSSMSLNNVAGGLVYFIGHLLGIVLVCAVSIGDEGLQNCDPMTPGSVEGGKQEIVNKMPVVC